MPARGSSSPTWPGSSRQGTSVQYVYTAAEVVRLVTEAGFTQVSLYGDTDETPFRLGSPRLLLVARKEM